MMKIDEILQGEAAFLSSPRIRRSPVRKPQTTENPSQTASKRIDARERENIPESMMGITQPAHSGIVETLPAQSSPKQEFILKMRQSEEEALTKCQTVIRRIRSAMAKQRNISLDVQNGVSELEELIDIMKSCRRNWKDAEREKEASKTITNTREDKNGNDISTPLSSLNKRVASSPAEIRPGKKVRGKAPEVTPATGKKAEEEEEWETVKSKKTVNKEKKERRKLAKQRPEAVIIHPSEGRSYADVLKNIRSKIKPEESEIAISTVRKTKTGAILIEMRKGGKKDEFRENLKSVLKHDAVVRDLTPMVNLEIRDLDVLTTTDEVLAAVEKETGITKPDITIRMTEANSREQRRAFVSASESCANILLKSQRIKIGWTNCRIMIRKELVRCFRCFESGHRQWMCDGPDRKSMDLCIKCGEKGHRKKECRNAPKCCICSAKPGRMTDHLPGSRGCMRNKQKSA